MPTLPSFAILIFSFGKTLPFAVPNINCVFPDPVCSFSIYELCEASLDNHILTFPLLLACNPPLNTIFAVEPAVWAPLTNNVASGITILGLSSVEELVVLPTNKFVLIIPLPLTSNKYPLVGILVPMPTLLPVIVEHEIVPTVILGVPVRPEAFVADVAFPLKAPLNVVAVTVPVPALILLLFVDIVEHEIVPTVILGVPVRPEAFVAVVAFPLKAPLNVVAVTVPVPALILLLFVDIAPSLAILNLSIPAVVKFS